MPPSLSPNGPMAPLAENGDGEAPGVPWVEMRGAATSRSLELSLGPKREGEGVAPWVTKGEPQGDLGTGGLPMSGWAEPSKDMPRLWLLVLLPLGGTPLEARATKGGRALHVSHWAFGSPGDPELPSLLFSTDGRCACRGLPSASRWRIRSSG